MRCSLAPLAAAAVAIWACALAGSGGAGDPLQTLVQNGRERSYMVHVPPSYDGTSPIPLVVAFHGGGGNAENQARVSQFQALGDEAGFLVAYPNGTGRLLERVLTWNGGGCCGYAQRAEIDDVGFVRALVGDLESDYSIDRRRVYATGFSNGAILAYRLACEASDVFAAIGPVSGTQMVAGCDPREPVSVIHVHGTEDQHLPYEGGVGDESLTKAEFLSVPESIAFWLLRDACPSRAEMTRHGEAVRILYAPCAAGTAVELVKIEGGGHAWPGSDGPAWPGGDEPTQTVSATELIWTFFAAHPKP